MRTLTINRNKKFVASLAKAYVLVDGNLAGVIKNGETLTIEINEDQHEISIKSPYAAFKPVLIDAGNEDHVLTLDVKTSGFFFVIDENATGLSEQENAILTKPQAESLRPRKQLSQTGSIISTIVIAVLMIALALILYSIEFTSIVGLLLGVVFAGAMAGLMAEGGFWFYLIPLPFIYIFNAGCSKKHLPLKRRVILGILIFICFSLYVASILVFSREVLGS